MTKELTIKFQKIEPWHKKWRVLDVEKLINQADINNMTTFHCKEFINIEKNCSTEEEKCKKFNEHMENKIDIFNKKTNKELGCIVTPPLFFLYIHKYSKQYQNEESRQITTSGLFGFLNGAFIAVGHCSKVKDKGTVSGNIYLLDKKDSPKIKIEELSPQIIKYIV